MFFLFCRMCTMCAEINDLIPLLLLLHYKVKVVHHVLGCIYFFNTGTSLCLRWQPATWNIFVFGTKALFWCHILWVKNGRGKKREMGTIQKKKKSDRYFCLLHKCLLGWGNICLLVCENQWLIILFMAKNHQSQASGANLCFKGENDCNVYIFVFVQCKYEYF